MSDKRRKKGQTLMVELQNYRQQGISIWLDQSPYSYDLSDPAQEALSVREDISYMENKENRTR